MKREEYEQHDAVGLAALIRRREVTPGEALDAALAAVDAANPALNAVVTRFDAQARAAIAAGLPEGPFTGVPYLLKDLGLLYQATLFRLAGQLELEQAWAGRRPPR
jgi:amidase